jgi:hypothetical protein
MYVSYFLGKIRADSQFFCASSWVHIRKSLFYMLLWILKGKLNAAPDPNPWKEAEGWVPAVPKC